MNWLLNLTPRMALLLATALASVVFLIDVLTGAELRVYAFYFPAIILAGTRSTRSQTYAFSLYCALLWVSSKYFDGTQFSSQLIWIWNTTTQALAFGLVGDLVHRLAATIDAEKSISQQLGNFSAELADRNQHLQNQQRQLQQVNADLEEAIRAVEDAERIARHDLRTPLSSIVATIDMLMSRQGLADDDLRLLASAHRAARHATAMVNLSLALRKMEQGRYVPQNESIDLQSTLRAVAEDLKEHADAKGVLIDIDGSVGLQEAIGSPDLAYAMIANILKNAIEAAPDGTPVKVFSRTVDGMLLLSISNAGAVPQDIRERFFNKYITSGKVGGTGLGAYSARLMARALGGDLTMTTADGIGTTLSLKLPQAGMSREAKIPPPVPVARPIIPAESFSVLIVDDDEYNRLVLARLLPADCTSVEMAVNGRVAVNRVRQQRPDLIFMDINMPIMGGIEALNSIRAAQKEAGQTPSVIVAFSALSDGKSEERYRALGFDACLGKPCSRLDVLALLAGRHDALLSKEDGPESVVAIDADLMPMVGEFRSSRAALLEQLVLALDKGDRDTSRKLAHQLGGSLGIFGFHWASRACKAIEEELAGGSTLPSVARAQGILAHVRTVALQVADPTAADGGRSARTNLESF